MKAIKLTLILFFSFNVTHTPLFSQKPQTKEEKQYVKKYHIKSTLSKVYGFKFGIIDSFPDKTINDYFIKNGNLIKRVISFSEHTSDYHAKTICLYQYDSKGNIKQIKIGIILRHQQKPDTIWNINRYTCDVNGNITQEEYTSKDQDGTYQKITVYKNDSKGYILEETSYTHLQFSPTYANINKNEKVKGNKLTYSYQFKDGYIVQKQKMIEKNWTEFYTYKYDSLSNVIIAYDYHVNNKMYSSHLTKTNYKYNLKGLILEKQEFTSKGRHLKTQYSYNDSLKETTLTSLSIHEEDGTDSILKVTKYRTSYLDTLNNLREKLIDFKSMTKTTKKDSIKNIYYEFYQYQDNTTIEPDIIIEKDSLDRIIKRTHFHINRDNISKTTRIYKYEYYPNNKLKSEENNDDIPEIQLTRYSYEFY